jgi:hypothetical protein
MYLDMRIDEEKRKAREEVAESTMGVTEGRRQWKRLVVAPSASPYSDGSAWPYASASTVPYKKAYCQFTI